MRILTSLGLTLFLLFFSPIIVFCQLNMVLQDSMDYNVGVNDVCGWVDNDGNEYALVGLNTGVSIVDINSTPIQEVAFVPGVDNLWRDINTYGHYAYVSSEARVGLLIIDLQYLPDSVQWYTWKDSIPTLEGMKFFEKAHSLWVDENGICYLNGSNVNNGGVVMIDVATNPIQPSFLGLGPAIYTHDCYARDSIIYSAEIYAGNASIYDAHDPQNVVLLGQVKTPHEFTHNTWLTDDSQYMFTTDERSNSYVTSYDISDPSNIIELDRYRQASTEGLGNIVHNAYVWDDWVIVAYYANGTTIVDGSRPDNLVEVGNFDSFLGADGGFPGVWGSFPFFPSGKIISSDRNNGLFVFIPNYVRACFLEGTVIDSVTGIPLINATVTIESDEIVKAESTQFDGTFKMGKAIPGLYPVKVKKEGYYEKTLFIQFANGEVITPIIELVPIPSYVFSGKVIDHENAPVPFAKVGLFSFEGSTFETISDENGEFLMPLVYEGTYELQSGIWGKTYETIFDMTGPTNLTIQVFPGYYDDFDLDLGWTVSGQVTEGAWVRGIPTRQLLFDNWECGSGEDSPNDLGNRAYSTGLSSSGNVANDEVSGGTTWLVSPPMDLTESVDPKISFDYWSCELPPNQYQGIFIWLDNGVDTILLDQLRNDTIAGSWQSKIYDLSAIQGPLDQVRFMISARDTTTGEHGDYILKVHFDRFKLHDAVLSNGDPYASISTFKIYPNPVTDEIINIQSLDGFAKEISMIRVLDVQGRIVSTYTDFPDPSAISIEHRLEDGMYFLQLVTTSGEVQVEKIVVLK